MAKSANIEMFSAGCSVLPKGEPLLAASGTVFPWLAVRCPSCRDPWFWRAMSRYPHKQWLSWLLAQENCPKCGYDP